MANKALPRIVAGGAALLLFGGKKKSRRSKLNVGCNTYDNVDELIKLETTKSPTFPMALILYRESERSTAEALCEKYGSGGWATMMVSTEVGRHMYPEFSFPGLSLMVDAESGTQSIDWNTAIAGL